MQNAIASCYPFTAKGIGDAVYDIIRNCACNLRPDFYQAIESAQLNAKEADPASRAASVLGSILENARIGEQDNVPICQDTGTVWVCLEAGPEIPISPDIFSNVNDAVARAYEDGALRMSVVKDALFDRSNTQDNTPAFCEVRFSEKPGARLSVLLKGGGSDNASRVAMLPPGAGADGVREVVLNCVREKAANACPPLLVGVGVGATFDKVAGMAKHALLRPVGSPAKSKEAGDFEDSLLSDINSLEIGPGALGGSPTAIAVHLETAPCHIAALPVAVNMGCCAMRSATVELDVEGTCR